MDARGCTDGCGEALGFGARPIHHTSTARTSQSVITATAAQNSTDLARGDGSPRHSWRHVSTSLRPHVGGSGPSNTVPSWSRASAYRDWPCSRCRAALFVYRLGIGTLLYRGAGPRAATRRRLLQGRATCLRHGPYREVSPTPTGAPRGFLVCRWAVARGSGLIATGTTMGGGGFPHPGGEAQGCVAGPQALAVTPPEKYKNLWETSAAKSRHFGAFGVAARARIVHPPVHSR
jgi:hypothetical protein